MKLYTSIRPRRDGTVKVTGQDSQNTYVFEADAEGELFCEVTHEGDLARLLGTDRFYPADPADVDKAAALLPDVSVDDADEDFEKDSEDDFEDDELLNAPPVEANTPPASFRKPGKKKAK